MTDAQGGTGAPQVDLNALWAYVTEQVKGRITLPSLWRAMEAACPLALEGDSLVLGFAVEQAHQQGLLLDNLNRNTIEQVLEGALRRRVRIELILGTSEQDWEIHKEQQREAVRLQQQTREQLERRATAGDTWESVGEGLIRTLGATQHRALASVQGAFLAEAVEQLAAAYAQLMPELPGEPEERAYTRVLERIGERLGVPGALIAYEVARRRRGPTP